MAPTAVLYWGCCKDTTSQREFVCWQSNSMLKHNTLSALPRSCLLM